MLKILTAEQTRVVDAQTINREPIRSIDLMERAAKSCSSWIMCMFSTSNSITVFAGMGNNGGDAFAIARHLLENGYSLSVHWVKYSSQPSQDCQSNYQALTEMGLEVKTIESDNFVMPESNLIIDGLFGTGLSRPIDGFTSRVLSKINQSKAQTISVDIPSGVFSDRLTPEGAAIIEADYTLTFQLPKLASLLPDSGTSFGESVLLDIGLDKTSIDAQDSTTWYVNDISEYNKSFHRNKFDHKGVFGHALVAAGTKGKMGAAVLCNLAALRSGVGLCTAIVPEAGLDIIQTSIPEAMAITQSDDDLGEKIKNLKPDAVAVGPGLGTDSEALLLFEWLLQHNTAPMVIDADALNLLAANHKLMAMVPKGSILTPHLKEFDRLFGRHLNSFDRLGVLREKAKSLGLYIILKGAHTAIATPDGMLYFNSTGSPALATAGSGDCLTGILCGLLAQTNDPMVAAVCGVYIHGVCGEMASESIGNMATIAGDIISCLPDAISKSFYTT